MCSVKQMEIYTAELLVPDPSHFKAHIAVCVEEMFQM
jgi:hypothetical protein